METDLQNASKISQETVDEVKNINEELKQLQQKLAEMERKYHSRYFSAENNSDEDTESEYSSDIALTEQND